MYADDTMRAPERAGLSEDMGDQESANTSSRAGKPLRWTADRLSELRKRMEPWMRQQTAESLAFFIKGDAGLAREFQVSDDVCTRIVQQLIAEGVVEYRGATHLGYSWKGAVGRAVTLADLLIFAESRVDTTASAEKGRRDDSIERLTEAQFKDIKTVANLVARYVPGAEGCPDKVTSAWFAYDATQHSWELESHVEQWSDQHHEASWHRRRGEDASPGEVWSRKLNTLRSKHLASIRNLLDLAATQGVLPRVSRSAAPLRSPATEWQPIVRRWKRWILKQDPTASAQMLDVGLRALALAASRRRELSVRTTDWLAVRAELEAAATADGSTTYTHQQRDCARYAWRRIVSSLGKRFALAEEFEWPTMQDVRRSLVPDGAIIKAAAHAAERAVGDRPPGWKGVPFDYGGSWTTRDGVYARSFVEGDYGVADWITFSTAPADRLERLGFPERAMIDPTPEMVRGMKRAIGKDKKPYLLRFDTLVGRLRVFSQLAGWAHEHSDVCEDLLGRRYDFVAGDDLASLCDLKLVQAYSEWLREEAGSTECSLEIPQEGVPRVVCDLAIHLAKVATPFLEGRARKRAERLDAAGHTGEAAAARAEAAGFRTAGFALKEWGYKHRPSGATYKDIVQIADAWTGSNQRSGWLKLFDLVDLLLRDAEEEAGLTIEEQLAAIRAAEGATPRESARLLAWQTATWAALIRSAMLVNFVRKLPVRARALSEMRIEWWEAIVAGRRVAPWHRDAAVKTSIPDGAMKTKGRDYVAYYIRPELVGNPDHEAGARRDLVELWLRPHGAREFLLTEWREVVVGAPGNGHATERVATVVFPSPYLFPASASRGNSGHGMRRPDRKQTGLRWTSSSLSVHFADVVRAHADALGIDLDTLEKLQGGLRIHVARLLYGTEHAPKNLKDASLMLHHADSSITEALYCGRSAANAAIEVTASERSVAPSIVKSLRPTLADAERTTAAGIATSYPDSELVALLRDSIAEQRQRNDDLQRRLRELEDRLLAASGPRSADAA